MVDRIRQAAQKAVWLRHPYVYQNIKREDGTVSFSTEHEDAIIRAVLEQMAQMAETDRDWVFEGGDDVASWIRSFLQEGIA